MAECSCATPTSGEPVVVKACLAVAADVESERILGMGQHDIGKTCQLSVLETVAECYYWIDHGMSPFGLKC